MLQSVPSPGSVANYSGFYHPDFQIDSSVEELIEIKRERAVPSPNGGGGTKRSKRDVAARGDKEDEDEQQDEYFGAEERGIVPRREKKYKKNL